MFPYRVVAWSILVSVFAWTGQASAGWIIDLGVMHQDLREGPEGGDRLHYQVLWQANRIKNVLHWEGKPAMAFILDLNAETITQVDYEQRHYAVGEFSMMNQGAQLPPRAGPVRQDCKVETRKTGQQATIAGYPAVHYDVLIDGKLTSEVWLAKGITAYEELDPKKLEQLERFLAEEARQMLDCAGAIGLGFPFNLIDPTSKLAGGGYPVRRLRRGLYDISVVEVVQAASRIVPATEFQTPAGFSPKTFREMPPSPW